MASRILFGSVFAAALAVTGASAFAQATLDEDTKTVVKMFLAGYGDICNGIDEGYFTENPPPSWDLSWSVEWTDEPQTATLYQLFCFSGAYNVNDIYYIAYDDEFEGTRPVAFTLPTYEIVTEDPEDRDSALVDILITGTTSDVRMVNSTFDPTTNTVTDHALWRGVGDAASHGTWEFVEGQFILKVYDLDPTFDGEINPVRVLDYTEPHSTIQP